MQVTLASSRAVAAVMARVPTTGVGKTRLSPRLSEAARVDLSEAFLRDKFTHVLCVPGLHLAAAVAPPNLPADMAPWLPEGASVVAQRGSDLGARLEGVAEDLFARGARHVLLVDTDTPTLPPAFLDEAVSALASGSVDVVFGPAWDGGYYLIGLSKPEPSLFRDVAWSTSTVLRDSLAIARRIGLRAHLLQSWYDIDTPADLDRLSEDLERLSPFAPGFPLHTADVVRRSCPSAREPPRDEHWKTLSLRQTYANKWLEVTERVVELPTGVLSLYGVVRTSPCVGILPLVGETNVLLVRQFRYVARRFTWEMPTGGVHPGESLEDAARRELLEEAGVLANSLTSLGSCDTSKSVVDETAHLFVAQVSDEVVASAAPDETEHIERRVFSWADAMAMVESGEIKDAMTVVAMLAWDRR